MSPDLALFGISSHHVSNLGVVHDLHKWCVGVVACIISRLIPVLRCVDSCAQAQLRRLVPLLDRVLVERVAAKAQTTGGILLPEVAQHKLSEVRVYVFPFDTVVLHEFSLRGQSFVGCGGCRWSRYTPDRWYDPASAGAARRQGAAA